MGLNETMEAAEDNRPKWLQELENRKKKAHLAHEVGAGAQCMRCGNACPGLDLHFWRKICKNCKCSRDDHDVPNDEFPQFDLLFGSSGKPRKKQTIVLRLNNNKNSNVSINDDEKETTTTTTTTKKKEEEEVEETFEWAPPGTTKELAADYMKALPEDKLPIKGSSGAALRKQQLQRQLPLHDIDHKHCDELTDSERKQFEKYLENLKKYVGQGQVIKLMGARPFGAMTPASAADMNRYSPEQNSHRSPPTTTTTTSSNYGINLRTPSSFVVKNDNEGWSNPSMRPRPRADSILTKHVANNFMTIISSENSPQGRYHRVIQKIDDEDQDNRLNSTPVEGASLNPPANIFKKNKLRVGGEEEEEEVELAERMLSEALRPPSAINASEIIGSSLDEEGLSFIREKLSSKYSTKEDGGGCCSSFENNKKNESGAAAPLLHAHQLLSDHGPTHVNVIKSEYLENPVFPDEASPIILDNHNNKNKMDELRGGMERLLSVDDEAAAAAASAAAAERCEQCREPIRLGDVAVSVNPEKAAKNAFWHPGCFVCTACNELLADLVYFCYKGKLYCGRDLATLLEIPRCFACDELIFVREYTVAEGHNYHVKHFCCWDCDMPLAGQKYISENDRPLCLPCYQNTYAKTCRACNSVIAAHQQGVAVKNLNFHANPQCFCCATCKKSLLNGKMAIKEERPFCSKECIANFHTIQ